MSETVSSVFLVKGRDGDDIWLKDTRRGLTVAVEGNPNLYSGPIRRAVQKLSEYDRIEATVESQNALHTIWLFTEIARLA